MRAPNSELVVGDFVVCRLIDGSQFCVGDGVIGRKVENRLVASDGRSRIAQFIFVDRRGIEEDDDFFFGLFERIDEIFGDDDVRLPILSLV